MPRQVKSFFDSVTATWSHVLWDTGQKRAAIIDPVLDYDPYSGRTSTHSADHIIEFVSAEGLALDWVLETHAHADHMSCAQHIKERLGGTVAISDGIRSVQNTFKKVFDLGSEFDVDGSQFDRLLHDGEHLSLGDLEILSMATPGHTSDSMSLRVDDAVFIGDTMFSPVYGTARCDFPGGDAKSLYRSIGRLLALPADTTLYLCHDYPGPGQSPIASTSVASQQKNIHVGEGVTEEEFIAMRDSRDATLELPRLLLPSIQVNIRAGRLPEPAANGVSYLKIPLNEL
ncbi:MAG: MBL fold metallo-hydrolase [Gammaproteobacteria bacterium]|nr:MBL fold metallo-hydrolase [Gammaproteobacteria bacterium]MDH3767143.1 MBL fold metallo-hydrolase [Gammaproteobacteria bacterium]